MALLKLANVMRNNRRALLKAAVLFIIIFIHTQGERGPKIQSNVISQAVLMK